MKLHRTLAIAAAIALAAGIQAAADWPITEKLDLDAIFKIKEEGLTPQRSKVMEIESYLTDVYGPRLTGSPEAREAADWTEKTMKEWGLANVHAETFPFGRGWHNERFTAVAVSPRAFPIIGYPKAWTPGTNGPVTGEATVAVIESDKDFDQFRGKLRGKYVLTADMRDVPAHFSALGHRYTEEELNELSLQPEPNGRGNFRPNPERLAFQKKKMQFYADEGVAALVDPSPRGDGGTVFVQSPQGVSRDPKDPLQPAQVVVAIEHYGRIFRMLQKHVPVTLQMDIQNKFFDADQNSFNIVGEIPGSDKADEIVMLGAHFDSWHGATGATANAAGISPTMLNEF